MDVHTASCGLETNASSGRGTGRSGPALPLYFSLPVLLVESLCLLNASDDSSCPWATWLMVVCPALPHHPSLPLLACLHVPSAAADGPSSVPPQCFCTCCSFSWNASCLPGDQPVRCGQSLMEGPPHMHLLSSPPIRGDSFSFSYSPCITSGVAPSVFVYMSSITPQV